MPIETFVKNKIEPKYPLIMTISSCLIFLGFMLAGCGGPGSTKGAAVVEDESTERGGVLSVEVDPPSAVIFKGESASFVAVVVGDSDDENADANAVEWKLEGTHKSGTAAEADDDSVTIAIAADETNTELKLTATAKSDADMSDFALISVVDRNSIVKSVTIINPPNDPVNKGDRIELKATVECEGSQPECSDFVVWDITCDDDECDDDDTVLIQYIDEQKAEARVSPTENSSAIVVRASSLQDRDKNDTAVLTIEGTVSSVEITPPKTVTVKKGAGYQFKAIARGSGSFNNNVNWSLKDSSNNSQIDNDGLLEVSKSEAAQELIVRAVSQDNPRKFDTATVTIDGSIGAVKVDSITLDPSNAEIEQGARVTFKATIVGENLDSSDFRANGVNISAAGGVSLSAGGGFESFSPTSAVYSVWFRNSTLSSGQTINVTIEAGGEQATFTATVK